MSNWDLLKLYYKLGDGIVWQSDNKFVMFTSYESARSFKLQAGEAWRVAFTFDSKPDTH